MGKKQQQRRSLSQERQSGKGWIEYLAEPMEKEPKSPWEMVTMALGIVLRTAIFMLAIIVKLIKGGINMGIRGILRRKKKEEVQPFAFDPRLQQQMQQQPYPPQQPVQQMPQQPMQQQPMPQQPAPLPPPPQQQVQQQPLQPAATVERIPVNSPIRDPVQIEMLNEVYGSIGVIRESLVNVQRILSNIHTIINNIYQRLNAIEGVQPLPLKKRRFVKKK